MKTKWFLIAALSAGLCGCGMFHKDDDHKMAKHEEKEEEEGNEVKMTLDQVPGPVRDTLMREAGGAKIGSVDKETNKKGDVVYETDVKSGGKTWEIRVDPSGKVISKKVEEE